MEFNDKWYKFDGFSNLPSPIRVLFGLNEGSWEIKKIEREGQGASVSKHVIEIWGDENTGYASLIQLSKNRKGFLPEVVLEEPNQFSFRAFHLDIARGGVPTLHTLVEILKWLFILKYNKFGIYFEDLFPWNDIQGIGKNRGRLSLTEWKNIVGTGASLGIDVFPSLELLGHMEHILDLPKFQKFSEFWWMNTDCLDVSNTKATDFTTSLLKDAIKKTKSNLIHIGGDETWLLGRGKSLDKLKSYKGPDLYLDYYQDLVRTVVAHKKTPMLWGDMLTGMYLTDDARSMWSKVINDPLWNEVLIANWDYEPLDTKHFIKRIREIGHEDKQIVCPALNNWSTFYPDFESAIRNVDSFITAAEVEQLPGYMITAWGDSGQESLFSFLNPLLMVSADHSSSSESWPRKFSVLFGEDINSSYARFYAGTKSVGPALRNVIYSPISSLPQRRTLPNNWQEEMKKFYRSAKRANLSPDMMFILSMVSNAIDLAERKFNKNSYIDMVHRYEKLWLKERKPEGLENVVSRLMGAFEVYRLRIM